jgi:hypothetical protein
MRTRLIALLLALVLISCTPKSRGVSILSGQVCGKSCWNNIVVGKTDKRELLEIIRTLPDANQDSITMFDESHGMFDGRIFFSINNNPTDIYSAVNVSAYTINQIVVDIIFRGDLGTNFKDIVDAYGEPELVSVAHRGDGIGIDIVFIDPTQGIEFGVLANSEKSSISPDTEIRMLELLDITLYQQLLESHWLTPGYKEFVL